ncbi:MAG: hypothetical protein ACI4BD_03800 [Paludibacteraceae bacterium]
MATIVSKYLKRLSVCFVLLAAIGLCSCDPNAKAYTKHVEIDINIQNVSAGFVEVEFSTNREAFYLISIQPAKENVDPQEIAKSFMLLALDSAYIKYLEWRNIELQKHTPFVADFASHSLQYGTTNRTFCFLKPNTDYWIFAFGVDPETNKPFGKLFLQTVTTKQESTLPVDFHYRVLGEWDYVYPKDTAGEIISDVPWAGITVDSAAFRVIIDTLRSETDTIPDSPGWFLTEIYKAVYSAEFNSMICYGVVAHQNNGDDSGTTSTKFEEGHTYYSVYAILDGPLSYPVPRTKYDIYRFTWHGDSTDLYFTSKDCTGGEW